MSNETTYTYICERCKQEVPTGEHFCITSPAHAQPESARCPVCLSDSRTTGNMVPCTHAWHRSAPSVQPGPSVEEIAAKHFPDKDVLSWLRVSCRRRCAAAIREALAASFERVAELKRQLSLVDEAIARRPALADAPDRYTAVYRACTMAGRAESAEATLKLVRETLEPTYVLLEGLRLAIQWELAPEIKAEIARIAPMLSALLSQLSEGEGK